ncbi:bestrophin family ion channel [Luteibacter sp. PPL201]|jgi:putative membrane protein|uniref:Bestrophin family ion channel n=1 Tax=Luteibacter sahnii TaxID=3021977 RepID=A0ABT6B921_9GAMM|nr:bestrophin family ion channel [Luteibacter sp. PPL193]MDY1550023.1 bestrophin family ion channel [Luteibacter sp. PPL193]
MILPGRAHIGHILRYVGRPLFWLLAWDVVVTGIWCVVNTAWAEFPALPLTLLGSAVAVYLSFRNTTAYARWWEARTLWGAMVNTSRTLAREAATLLTDRDTAVTVAHRQIAYVQALRLHLRRQPLWDELADRLPADEIERLRHVANVPNAIHARTAAIIAQARPDPILHSVLARTMSDISNAQGGMERIKNTPLPQQYATYPTVFTHGFCILLPLGLVETLGLYTPLGSTVAGFLFLALLQIGNDIQNPFENLEDDVPLTTLTRAIEIDLRDGLGEAHGLEPVKPVNGILW